VGDAAERREKGSAWWRRLLPFVFPIVAIGVWELCCRLHAFPPGAVPTPAEVASGFVEEVKRGRMFDDIVASLYRVSAGFALSVILGVPAGLAIGLELRVRQAFLPTLNFFRNLSPLAWIPFAIMWFGIGDVPAIFLIFMTAFFPIALAAAAAVANIPSVYFRVANDYGLRGGKLLTELTLPAIMPQIITSLRVTAGLSWVIVVAAEMIAGRDGLGFLIWDARNQLRPDLLVVGMIVIGIIGVVIDRLLLRLTRIPSVRWGYER
jgi:NitT/TauT family transport system permease protein